MSLSETNILASRHSAVLAADTSFLDVSTEFREFCRSERPEGNFPGALRSILTESAQVEFDEQLAACLRDGRIRHLNLAIARGGQSPLTLPTLLVPNPQQYRAHAFFLLEGAEGADENRLDAPPDGLSEGLLVLRPDGDLSRMVVVYGDAVMSHAISADGASLLGKTLYQIFTVESTTALFKTIDTVRMCRELRRCVAKTRAGRRLHLSLFAADRSIFILGCAEAVQRDSTGFVPVAWKNGEAVGVPFASSGYWFRERLQRDLEPSLNAVTKLCDSLNGCLAPNSLGRRRLTLIEDLAKEMRASLEAKCQTPEDPDPSPRQIDVVGRIISAVEGIARPPLEEDSHQVVCIDEVGMELRLHATYPIESLQQIAIDLIADAARLYKSSLLTFRIHQDSACRGSVRLNFEISAEPRLTETRVPFEVKPDADLLRSRPVFRSSLRFLRVLDSEIRVRASEERCSFLYSLSFSRPVAGVA